MGFECVGGLGGIVTLHILLLHKHTASKKEGEGGGEANKELLGRTSSSFSSSMSIHTHRQEGGGIGSGPFGHFYLCFHCIPMEEEGEREGEEEEDPSPPSFSSSPHTHTQKLVFWAPMPLLGVHLLSFFFRVGHNRVLGSSSLFLVEM